MSMLTPTQSVHSVAHLLPSAFRDRPVDRWGIRVESRAHSEKQAGSDDEDRPRRRINARGIGEVRKTMHAHAPGEPDRGQELTLCRPDATGGPCGSEPCACHACGLECWGLRVDPGTREIDPAPSSTRIGEARHAVCAHAVGELDPRGGGARMRRVARATRRPAGTDRCHTADRKRRKGGGSGSCALACRHGPLFQRPL